MRTKLHKAVIQELQNSSPYEGREGLVYARVSSKRQETEGSGLQSQEGRCKRDLELVGVPYLKTFPDSFTGGGDFMERPAMRALLDYVDAKPHKRFVVVFDDLKRFARNVEFHFKLKAAFKTRDVELRCLNYNFDDSDEGWFGELIMAGHAELERRQNRRQVVQKMKARLEMGYWPFAGKRGYDMPQDAIHGKLLVPNKEGLTMIKPVLEKFASGDLVRRVDVARFLFDRGFWPKSKRSAESYIDEVGSILQDVIHCGDVEYLRWDVSRRPGKHKGIISRETFEQIERRLSKDVAKSHIRNDISADFPLRGLVLCPACNGKLTAAPCRGRSKIYEYYYCPTKGCSLYSQMLSKKDVERDFRTLLQHNRLKTDVEEVVQLTFDRVWKEEVHEMKALVQTREKHRKEQKEKIRDLTELTRKTRSEPLKRAYEEQIEEIAIEVEQSGIQGAKSDLGVPYRTALHKSTTMLKNPISIWDIVGVVEKQRLFFFLFEAKLPYTKHEGYRTGNELSTTRLFEEFADENSASVDLWGVEPQPRQCE